MSMVRATHNDGDIRREAELPSWFSVRADSVWRVRVRERDDVAGIVDGNCNLPDESLLLQQEERRRCRHRHCRCAIENE